MEVLIHDATLCRDEARARLKAHEDALRARGDLEAHGRSIMGAGVVLLMLMVLEIVAGSEKWLLAGLMGKPGNTSTRSQDAGEDEDLLVGMARVAVSGTAAAVHGAGSVFGFLGVGRLITAPGRVLVLLLLLALVAGLKYVWDWRVSQCKVLPDASWMVIDGAWRQSRRLIEQGEALTVEYTHDVAGHTQSDRIGKEHGQGDRAGAGDSESADARDGLRRRAGGESM